MRALIIFAAAFAAGTVLSLASASAESPSYSDAGFVRTTTSSPTFDDCFRLAWVRGVHVERFELSSFNEQCMANRIPFESGYAATSVKRGAR